MHRTRLHCCLGLLVALAWPAVGSAEDSEPFFEVTLPNAEQTRERFAQSIYGQILLHERFAPVRMAIEDEFRRDLGRMGLTIEQLLQAPQWARLQMVGFEPRRWGGPEPTIRMEADLGPLTEQLFALTASGSQPGPNVPGADGVVMSGSNEYLARFGSVLQFTTHVPPQQPVAPTDTGVDVPDT